MKALLLVIVLLVFCGCNKRSTTTVTGTATNGIDSDSILRGEIERGLQDQFNVFMLPIGDIEIIGSLHSQVEKTDLKHKRFVFSFGGALTHFQKLGLVNFTYRQQSEKETILRKGSQTVTVYPTELAKKHSDRWLSSQDYVAVPIATAQVRQIVSSDRDAEDNLYVVGLYSTRRLPWFEAISRSEPIVGTEFRFRALLSRNPQTMRYAFQCADWGRTEKTDWETNYIPEFTRAKGGASGRSKPEAP